MEPSKLAKKKIKRVEPDLIHELDNRYECIRHTLNKAELQKLLKVFDELQIGSSRSVRSPSLQQKDQKEQKETPPPSRNGYCFLYVQSNEKLSRLNVSKLSEGPKFELVCDFGRSHPRNCLSPVVCFNVGSEIYMVGDVYVYEKQWPKHSKPVLDVLSIDTGKSPSFLPCPGTVAAGFAGPKVDPLVVTLNGKIYVLALQRYVDRPSFEVFDNGKWGTLPCPPIYSRIAVEDERPLCTEPFFRSHYAWGHKIVVCLEWGISYCFDTKTGKWINMKHIYKEGENIPVLQCVAEYNNFLIGKPFFSEELVVYELDANGYPHFYQDLAELEEMFVDSRVFSFGNSFIIPFDDDADKFYFICSGSGHCTDMDRDFDYFLSVAVFRMTISNLDGKEKLTAVLEAHQSYPFYYGLSIPYICSAFLKRDNFNLDNLKVDRSFGRACLD